MKLRYAEIEPSKIYNRLAIFNLTCWQNAPINWRDTWWEDETLKLRQQFTTIWQTEFDRITNHFGGLEDSIREHGIRSPISLISGPLRSQRLEHPDYEIKQHIPPQFRSNLDNMMYTQPFGGSRLAIAERIGIEKVPCIVHDFSNLYPNEPEVTAHNFNNWFKGSYFFCGSLPYVRDGSFTANTRNAQQEASRIAKEKMNV